MTNRAEELITQLEAEIAERDARIEALEVDIVYLKSVEKERNALRDELAALKAQKPGADPSNRELLELSRECAEMKGGAGMFYANYGREVLRRWGKTNTGVVPLDLIAELKKQAEEIARKGHAWWGNTMLSAAEALSVAGVVDERAAFELADRSGCFDVSAGGEYQNPYVQSAWEGWQARARLNPCCAQAVPDGYVLVPVDPTPEMLDRYPFNVSAATSDPMDKEDLRVVYQAMLAAAPSAKKEPSDE